MSKALKSVLPSQGLDCEQDFILVYKQSVPQPLFHILKSTQISSTLSGLGLSTRFHSCLQVISSTAPFSYSQKHSNQFYPLRGWIVNKISFLFTSNQFHLQPLFHILEVITYESFDCRLIDILTLMPLRLSTAKIVLRWSS